MVIQPCLIHGVEAGERPPDRTFANGMANIRFRGSATINIRSHTYHFPCQTWFDNTKNGKYLWRHVADESMQSYRFHCYIALFDPFEDTFCTRYFRFLLHNDDETTATMT